MKTDEFNLDDGRLDEMIAKLVEIYSPERVYLFGSFARGDAGPDSDYDLMVIVPDDTPRALRDNSKIYDHMWDLGVAADVLVWTESAYQRRLHIVASLPATIEREGKVLYAA